MQQTSRLAANKHRPSFAEGTMRCFLMDESTFSVSTCPLHRWSTRGSVLWSYRCECRWWARLCALRKHMAQSPASGLQICVWDKTKMTISGWNKTNEIYQLLKALGSLMLLLIDSSRLSDDIFKPLKRNKAEKKSKVNPSTYITSLRMDLQPTEKVSNLATKNVIYRLCLNPENPHLICNS